MNFQEKRRVLLAETKQKIAASVSNDNLIIQAVTTLEQLEQASNRLVKKGREWYGFYFPEGERSSKLHKEFLENATRATRSELMKELKLKSSMGGDLSKEDEEALQQYLRTINALFDEQEALEAYIETKMRDSCPNLTILAGSRIGGQLLSHAGSLQKLATVPSSTLQLYGAETALFRHLKDKSHRAPKYGILFNHPLIQNVGAKERGKAARSLSDKLSICAKLDYFKGELKAQEYKEQLEKKFVKW